MSELALYIQNNYGWCLLNVCLCLINGEGPGMLCGNWQPVRATSWEEVVDIMRERCYPDE